MDSTPSSVITGSTSLSTSTTSEQSRTTSSDPIDFTDRFYDVTLFPVDEARNWKVVLTVPNGDGKGQVGESDAFGPGLPVSRDPDGIWWIPDIQKSRLLAVQGDARFEKEVPLEADGVAGPIIGLFALDDGSLVGMTSRSQLAVLEDDQVEYTDTGLSLLTLVDSDGSLLFGFTPSSQFYEVDLSADSPIFKSVDYLRTPTGERYMTSDHPSGLSVALPDAYSPTRVHLQVTDETGGEVFFLWETIGASDGGVHVLLYGFALSDESTQLSTYIHIGKDGILLVAEPAPNPFGEHDPGSPNHLGLDRTTNRPYIAVVDDDALRIWELEQVQ